MESIYVCDAAGSRPVGGECTCKCIRQLVSVAGIRTCNGPMRHSERIAVEHNVRKVLRDHGHVGQRSVRRLVVMWSRQNAGLNLKDQMRSCRGAHAGLNLKDRMRSCRGAHPGPHAQRAAEEVAGGAEAGQPGHLGRAHRLPALGHHGARGRGNRQGGDPTDTIALHPFIPVPALPVLRLHETMAHGPRRLARLGLPGEDCHNAASHANISGNG